MLDRRHDAGFAEKALPAFRVVLQLRLHDLEGHGPPQPDVLGLEDQGHAALAEQFEDAGVEAEHGHSDGGSKQAGRDRLRGNLIRDRHQEPERDGFSSDRRCGHVH